MTAIESLHLEKKAKTDYQIFPLLQMRWSPRTFDDREIQDQELNQLLEAARWAASSYNRQPWRFIYAKKGTEAYDRIVDCLSDFNKRWAATAPLLLLSAYKEKTENGDDNFHALHDLGLSLGNMGIQAQHMGIVMHHMAGIDWKKAQDLFEVPDGFHITTAIAIGYYGGNVENLPENLREQEVQERTRNPITTFAFEGKWKEES